jgi:hypothetical protein
MSAKQVELGGTLKPDGTLVLDHKPDLPPGRVKVVLQAVDVPTPPPQETLLEYIQRVRAEREKAGYPFMTDEEVTAWIEELRADDERIEEVYRQIEEARRKQG